MWSVKASINGNSGLRAALRRYSRSPSKPVLTAEVAKIAITGCFHWFGLTHWRSALRSCRSHKLRMTDGLSPERTLKSQATIGTCGPFMSSKFGQMAKYQNSL